MSRTNLIKSIQKSANKALQEKKVFNFNRDTDFIIKNPLPKEIDILKIIALLKNNLPSDCFQGTRNVYFGQFEKLKKRKLTALHHEGNIYIDNNVKSEKDLLDDLIHEFAHRFEENNAEKLYEDGIITNEFLGKRNRLFDLLKQEVDFELSYFDFLNTEYDQEFDKMLYQKIGYKLIRNVAPTLFIRPYAATSLREYFATGFEDYFLNGGLQLKQVSPLLYDKIRVIDKREAFKPQWGIEDERNKNFKKEKR